MKSMSCKQLGGACDQIFQANTFEEMAQQSKAHGMEMFKQGDRAHLKAMAQMKEKMQEPGQMEAWYAARKEEFENMPSD